MKKHLAIMLVLISAIVMLSACGGGGGSSGGGGGGQDTPAVQSEGGGTDGGTGTGTEGGTGSGMGADTEGSTAPGQIVDMDDFDNYYAIIDGVKYEVPDHCTLKDMLDAGFTAADGCDVGKAVPYGVYVGESFMDVYVEMYKPGVEKIYFRAYPHNPKADPIPLKDCAVYGISFFNKAADISIVGGLSIGSTQKDFAAVFGDGPGEEIPGYTDKYMVKYASSDGYGYVAFSYKESTGEVSEISVSYISPDM